MDHNETGCQAPERPILCVNNCGFFGSPATMKMCAKCHKEVILNDNREKLAVSSIEDLVNGTSCKSKEPYVSGPVEVKPEIVESKVINSQVFCDSDTLDRINTKKGPSGCTTCQKPVGLMGFSCRCGILFCSAHRYSFKHECPFDYRVAGQTSIAKANPVIKTAKLDKI